MSNINIEDICNICIDILIENINIKSNQIKLKISTRNPNKVQLDSNTNVQLDSNSNVQLDSNSNVQLDSNSNVQLDYNTNVQLDTDSNVQLDTDRNVQLDTDRNVQLDSNSNVQLDTDRNINLNPNLELLKILTDYRNIKKTNSKCKLCEICDLNESNILFKGDLTNFSLQNFFNHFNIINTSIPLNKYNILNGTILNGNILNDNILNGNPLMGNPLMGNPLMGNPLMGNILNGMNIRNKILKGLNYYIICLKLNKNQFENEIIIKFGSDIYINFSNYTLQVKRSFLVDKRLKSIVMNIFLRELNTIDQESILFKNFKKLQENHLLYEQLIQVKPCILYDGEYILKIIRNKISFVGYYNKFHRNISQTNWYLDRPDVFFYSVELFTVNYL
ncbi:uncharacterized protein TA20370 [Theileria annulata]|uniref:Uncharacterized protein n=1 Tax=Theileria annulata TaxID=5874 RepID=Q4UH83_THEAN|nr:uncharacterized protein TA20370 [Theileria annulata]CAI73556.1 hypothetical protein TA20370 [Theileria annulata]|eukprot:XP_954233.1 hypothetical protein TA20370 [Theileria annulata]